MLYLAEGRFQVVLTPETKFEKDLLSNITPDAKVEILNGSFYSCQGGWDRHSNDDRSVIIVCDKKEGAN